MTFAEPGFEKGFRVQYLAKFAYDRSILLFQFAFSLYG